jgi:Neprosin
MKSRIPQTITLLSLGVAGAVGCAGQTGDEGPKSELATTASASEDARIQQIIDARYKKEDVRYSFRTRLGEDIDCIDFEAQPSVKALRAQGIPVSNHAPPVPERFAKMGAKSAPVDPANDYSFNGSLDENGHARACSADTVPMLRVTADDIRRAGGVDEYQRPHRKALPPHLAPGGCDVPGFAHVVGTLTPDTSAAVYGAGSIMSVHQPLLPANETEDHSLAQTWTYGGGNTSCSDPTGPSNLATLEVGWVVSPWVNNGDLAPHLFTFSTIDGYWLTGCYNNDPTKIATYAAADGFSGSKCAPYVEYGGAIYTPGQGVNVGSDLGANVWNFGNTALDWQLQITANGGESYYIGYWPSVPQTMTTFQAGGEVADITDTMRVYPLQMGTGENPSLGYGLGESAVQHDFWAATAANYIQSVAQFTIGETTPVDVSEDYTESTTLPGNSAWSNYFFYGGEIPFCVVNPTSPICHIRHF